MNISESIVNGNKFVTSGQKWKTTLYIKKSFIKSTRHLKIFKIW